MARPRKCRKICRMPDNRGFVPVCGGIGGGAQMALAQAGIQLYGGVSCDADQAAEAFVAGTLSYNPNVICNHHGVHHHEGDCASQGCGHHSCS